jgi:hypothetical protein
VEEGKGWLLVGADGESKNKDAYVLAVKITPDGLTGGERCGLEDMAKWRRHG